VLWFPIQCRMNNNPEECKGKLIRLSSLEVLQLKGGRIVE